MNESRPPLPFETMCISLYAYRLGTIDFSELVVQFEEAVGIRPPRTVSNFSDQGEIVDPDSHGVEAE